MAEDIEVWLDGLVAAVAGLALDMRQQVSQVELAVLVGGRLA